MLTRMRTARDLVMETYAGWKADRTMRLGAGLAYYGLFAAVPLFTLTAALATALFSRADVEAFVTERLDSILQGNADEAAALVTDQLTRVEVQTGLEVVGGVTLLISGSLVFVALQDALNVIWHLPVESGIRSTIRRYALGFSVVVLMVAVIIGAMALQAVSGIIGALTGGVLEELDALVRLGASVVSWVLGAAALALLFRVLTHGRVGWLPALQGGAATAVAIVIGTWAIGWYLSRFATSSLSGAAGAVTLVLVWIYYEAQILLAGAQLTKVLAVRAGSARPT